MKFIDNAKKPILLSTPQNEIYTGLKSKKSSENYYQSVYQLELLTEYYILFIFDAILICSLWLFYSVKMPNLLVVLHDYVTILVIF